MPSYLQPAYRADIDGLRGIAVIAVVAFHAFPALAPGGFVGVDVFFVISGFLISTIVFRGLEEKRFSFAAFYARRIKRILPALAIVLAAFLALGALVLLAREYSQLGKQTAASAAFSANFLFWAESGYFDTEAELKPLLHLWSLAVEEQFYLFWPLLLFLLHRFRINLLKSTIFVVCLSFAANISIVRGHASAAFYLTPARMWEPLAGALLAYLTLYGPPLPSTSSPIRRNILATAGIVLVAIAIAATSRYASFPGWPALLPVAGAFLLVASGSASWWNRRILANPSLVFVGLISYPLYLWHWPLLSFARIVASGTPPPSIRSAAIAASFLLAWLTYRFAERPVRRSQSRFAPGILLALAGLAGCAGYSVYRHDGFASRFPADHTIENNAVAFAAYQEKTTRPCPAFLAGGGKLSFCHVSGAGEPTAAIFGDSHADHIFPGIADSDPARAWLLAGHTGCAPLSGVRSYLRGTPEACDARNQRILSALVATRSISTVVLSANAPYYLAQSETFTPGYTGAWSPKNWTLQPDFPMPAAAPKPDIFAAGLGRTIDALQHAGKRVILYLTVPELPFLPADCERRATLGLAAVCSIDRPFVLDQQAVYRAMIARVQREHPGILQFDPLAYLCQNRQCDIGRNAADYRDFNHLSLAGSRNLGRAFIAWLNEHLAGQVSWPDR